MKINSQAIPPTSVVGVSRIKKFISIYVNNDEDKAIGSKRFFRQWKYWTGLIAREKSRLSTQNKRTSNNLKKLYKKRAKWQNNLFNNLVAKAFRMLRKNNVSYLAVGNLTNIRVNNRKGRKLNQMVHNYWSFDLLLKKIRNKAEEFRMEFHHETEEYTSRTCPICGDNSEENCKDRIFVCSDCGYADHRDVVGARNILFKSMYGPLQSIHWGEVAPLEVAR